MDLLFFRVYKLTNCKFKFIKIYVKDSLNTQKNYENVLHVNFERHILCSRFILNLFSIFKRKIKKLNAQFSNFHYEYATPQHKKHRYFSIRYINVLTTINTNRRN